MPIPSRNLEDTTEENDTPADGGGDSLNPKQELFCTLYSSSEEFFGNGLRAYMKAYDIEPARWKSALASASRLLTKVNIITRINELLELRGLNDAFVDKQLEFLITQHADFKSKIAAIREYNSLKQRITKKVEHSGEIKTSSLTPEQIEAINKIALDEQ